MLEDWVERFMILGDKIISPVRDSQRSISRIVHIALAKQEYFWIVIDISGPRLAMLLFKMFAVLNVDVSD